MIEELDLDILKCECNSGNVKWTAHAFERMQERGIEPSHVKFCINNGRIIEQYPKSYPYPSCLILGITENNMYIHVVAGYGGGFLWIVTAYQPDENEWTNGFTSRKERV